MLRQNSENNSSPGFIPAVWGKITGVLPTVWPCSAGLVAGICWKKNRKTHYSAWVGGAWLQMTGVLFPKKTVEPGGHVHSFVILFTDAPFTGAHLNQRYEAHSLVHTMCTFPIYSPFKS